MENFYGQHDDSLHLALQEIRSDVIYFSELKQYSNLLLSAKPIYEYCDDGSFIARLSKFEPKETIKEIDVLIHALNKITENNICDIIVDEEDWDGNIIFREDERKFLIAKKDALYGFLIRNKNLLLCVSEVEKESFSGIEYKGALKNLKEAEKLLSENRFIDNSDDFINIFQDEPFEKKINWRVGANLLHYFMDKLSSSEFTSKNLIILKDTIWIVTSKIFTHGGKPIEKTAIKGNHRIIKSSKTEKIDKIIELLKS